MFLRLLALFCFLISFSLQAQTPNFDFEQASADGKPLGWIQFGGSGQTRLDSTGRHGGQYSVRLSGVGKSDFKAIDWSIPATFEGKTIKLTGYVKTQETGKQDDSFAGLWVRIDGESGTLQFDNMQSRGIKGTTGWTQYTITLPFPNEAKTIHIGGLLVGAGIAWFDDFAVTVDGKPFGIAPAKVVRLAKAQADTVFNERSGIDVATLTPQQVDNLAILGKVWGFMKYYHPAVAAGNHNMDAELFRVMPTVLDATSVQQRSDALLKWLETFGPVPATKFRPDTAKAVHKLDFNWLADAKQLSDPLRAQLESIRQARRTDSHFYIGMAPQVGNPEFKHELPYAEKAIPDAGYRLLALFRYWNIIQYFFPYKHLIGEDWNGILPEFAPQFVAAHDKLTYRKVALALIGRVHDTHANLWGSKSIDTEFRGDFYAAAQVRHIEGQFVVTNFYNDSLGRLTNLRRGDVIKTVDGVSTTDWVVQRRPYYPASNEPTQFRDLSRNLLRGLTNNAALTVARDGKPLSLTISRYTAKEANLDWRIDNSSYPKDSCYQLLAPDVGYLFLGNIESKKLPGIMKTFKNTKGLVIDLRCYPSDFVVFSLGKYLTQPVPFVKFTNGNVQTPGLFTWSPVLKVGQQGVDDAYKGKVVILVNEVTQSNAEYTTMAFRQAPGAIVMGSTTAAADGNVSPLTLPGGLRTMISGIGVNYPDGRETQRVGIVPDIVVKPTIKGIREGRDELLERALDLIREK
jgi:C-terminal processing protease CtpA/Prc